MVSPRVWFNKHLSNTHEVIALLDHARQSSEFRVVCSHPRVTYAQHLLCDHFEQEPIGLNAEDYVRFCLDFAHRNQVTVFYPGRKALAIVRAADRFAAIGVRLMAAADAATLALMGSKARVYAAAATQRAGSVSDGIVQENPSLTLPARNGNEAICIPDHAVVNDLAGFDAACARLKTQHDVVCYKPDASVFGIGFKVIVDRGSTKIAHGGPWRITHETARERLGREARFRDLIVMQYLPGPEHSVDCLAHNGQLLRFVVRRKLDGGQMLEDNPTIEAAVRQLTARLRLTNLFNVQFRDAGGQHYLLEINPRMSGGLPFACQSGLMFPLWAIRLALGSARADEIPLPRTGIWVPQPEPVSSL